MKAQFLVRPIPTKKIHKPVRANGLANKLMGDLVLFKGWKAEQDQRGVWRVRRGA